MIALFVRNIIAELWRWVRTGNLMDRCIFCDSTDNTFTRNEHIVPESMGGRMILPVGLVCDNCNNYFGRAVENHALNAPVISFMRAHLGAKNKRGKFQNYKGMNWELRGNRPQAQLVLSDGLLERVATYGEGAISFPAQIGAEAICRLMLKMSLEYIALSPEFDVFDSSFAEARRAARAPFPGTRWPFGFGLVQPESNRAFIVYDDNGEYLRELPYLVEFAFDNDFGMVGFHFIYGWSRFLIPVNNIGFENFNRVVIRHMLQYPLEETLTVINPDITVLDQN